MSSHRSIVLATIVALVFCTPGLASARAPSPEPAASATDARPAGPSPTPGRPASLRGGRAHRVHLGIVSCEGAPFYSWPDRSIVPSGSTYPPARMGEAINVIGDGSLANNGMTLYETTIDVVEPFGFGKHYYISAYCINAG